MKKANIVRSCFGITYILSSLINLFFAVSNPEVYRAWADTALLPLYRELMLNISTPLLQLCLITVVVCQVIIGLLVLGKNLFVKFGLFGGMVFHLGITPWGLFNLPNLVFVGVLFWLFKYHYDVTFIEMFRTGFRSKNHKYAA